MSKRRKPPYMIVINEDEIDVAKDWLNNKIGSYAFNRSIGRKSTSIRIARDEKVALTLVVASKHLITAIKGVRARLIMKKIMGSKDDIITTSFRAPKRLIDKLDAIARERGLPRNAVIIEALWEYIENTREREE